MLALFALCAVLMYARVLPALLAVPLMALGIAALAGGGPGELAGVIVQGSVRLAPVFVTVIFGALLSRVTLSTGIAETIVGYAAEFGGDRPAVLGLALVAAVALLFTSLTGLGAIIMVGSIALPIMLTIGIPRRTAATLFMLAFALGFIFNLAQWRFYTDTFGIGREPLQHYSLVLGAIDLAALLVFAFVRLRRARGYAAWALKIEDEAGRRRAPVWALATPILPLALYHFLKFDPIVAFGVAAVYGVLATRPRKAIETLVASAIRGVEDVAPAVLLFMGIGMLLVATGLPSVKAGLAPLVAALAPRSPLGYVVLFGLLSPLALYRGPLNPFGVGIAVYTVMAGLGVLPAITLVAAVMAVVQVQNVCDPTNTQNVWVANFTGLRVDEITKITLPFQVAVATLATAGVAFFGGQLLGVPPFARANAAAAATPARPAALASASVTPSALPPAGLFAPPDAVRTLAIVAADDASSREAADELERQIARGWSTYRTLRLARLPESTGCEGTRYTASLTVTLQPFGPASAPAGIDAGLVLRDCAGWPVDEWHEERAATNASRSLAPARTAGLALLFRLRVWMREHPELAGPLFERGLAYAAASAPTYFYTLFKTSDGQMRAYVRPGGPAYAAGLHTNDIVVKLDGKEWWQYGTFQTQARAYDGLPHAFEITRGAQSLTVRLGAPYRGLAPAGAAAS
jgi:hypothetical protein